MYKTFTTGLRPWEKRSPFGGFATTFTPVGSMSLDFQVATLPYKSSSFATPASLGALWVLCIVPHVSKGKHREAYSAS